MKEKFKAWSNLKYDKAAIANLLKTIVFRDILEFQELEADLLLSWRTSGDITSRVQAEADKLSMKVFGIVEKDTNFQFPADFDEMMDGSIRIEYKGKISSDEIKFVRKVGDFGTEEFVAKRVK